VHEYGIVQEMLARVDEQVRGHAGKRAVRVVVSVDGGHVDEAFLRDAFDTFKADTTARDAELVVTTDHGELWCPACDTQTTAAHEHETCPRCGGARVRMTSTDEIYLQSVEIEV
jgi:hydrogenase nickel incorporation protein HypA/HybF